MPSTLSWIDYDVQAQQRTQRILTLFNERETRDELGFGAIRDAISDTLFPGTSTLHTRLRYVFFLTWIYLELESRQIPSERAATWAQNKQFQLAEALLANCPGDRGIIGASAGRALKTLPSAVYWSSLSSWGLRQYPGTVSQYHQALDFIYQQRRAAKSRSARAFEEEDELDGLWEHGLYTWHPGTPNPPADFPASADFDLTREEARFLQERIKHLHPDSLLGDLMTDPLIVDIKMPWVHPDLSGFRKEHRTLLSHAHNFSVIAQGAAILYNQMLAALRGDDELKDIHHDNGQKWVQRFRARLDELYGWARDLSPFWLAVVDKGHSIGPITRRFVEDWCALILEHRAKVFEVSDAKALIEAREKRKKGANSRFTNKRVLDQWGGSSGIAPMTYRWNYVQDHIADIARPLGKQARA